MAQHVLLGQSKVQSLGNKENGNLTGNIMVKQREERKYGEENNGDEDKIISKNETQGYGFLRQHGVDWRMNTAVQILSTVSNFLCSVGTQLQNYTMSHIRT